MGKRELVFLISITHNFVVSVRRSFLFLWVLRVVTLLWHSLGLQVIKLFWKGLEHTLCKVLPESYVRCVSLLVVINMQTHMDI